MKSLINKMAAAVSVPVIANKADKGSECVVYDFYPTANDGIKQSVTLKLHIWAKTMARTIELQNAVNNAILTAGDKTLTGSVLNVVQNGGGWLEDGDWYCQVPYYTVTLRGATIK